MSVAEIAAFRAWMSRQARRHASEDDSDSGEESDHKPNLHEESDQDPEVEISLGVKRSSYTWKESLCNLVATSWKEVKPIGKEERRQLFQSLPDCDFLLAPSSEDGGQALKNFKNAAMRKLVSKSLPRLQRKLIDQMWYALFIFNELIDKGVDDLTSNRLRNLVLLQQELGAAIFDLQQDLTYDQLGVGHVRKKRKTNANAFFDEEDVKRVGDAVATQAKLRKSSGQRQFFRNGGRARGHRARSDKQFAARKFKDNKVEVSFKKSTKPQSQS